MSTNAKCGCSDLSPANFDPTSQNSKSVSMTLFACPRGHATGDYVHVSSVLSLPASSGRVWVLGSEDGGQEKNTTKPCPFYPSLPFWERGGDLASLLTTSEGAKARKQGLAFCLSLSMGFFRLFPERRHKWGGGGGMPSFGFIDPFCCLPVGVDRHTVIRHVAIFPGYDMSTCAAPSMSVAQRSKSWSCRGLQPPTSAALRPCLWSQRLALSGPFRSARPGLAVAEGSCLHSMRHVWKAQQQECSDHSLSLSLCRFVSVSLQLSPSFSVCLSLYVSPSLSICLFSSACCFFCLARSLSLSLSVYLNLSAAVPRSLPLSKYLCASLSLSISLSLFRSLSILPKLWSCARLTPLALSIGISSKKLGTFNLAFREDLSWRLEPPQD